MAKDRQGGRRGRPVLGASLAAAIPLLLLAAPAAGQLLGVDHRAAYAECMSLARGAPEAAFERALAWDLDGGGRPAQHCAAVALLGLGRYVEAAQRLERLAAEMVADTADLRAGMLVQVGQAWLLAGDGRRAQGALTRALELLPDNIELLIDRSIALAITANYWEAIDDLNRASDLAPQRADILILRASGYRLLEVTDLAGEDLARALRLDPDNPDALLERGILRRMAGDTAAARADWGRVLETAPDSPAAEAARANLERLNGAAK